MSGKLERDPYIAIMVAADKGRGVRLSHEECHRLAFDDAISTRAHNGLSADEWDSIYEGKRGWAAIDPRKKREPCNFSGNDPDDRLTTPPTE